MLRSAAVGGDTLADLVAAASLTGLQELSSCTNAGTSFLLHPLAAAPAFVETQPGPRLVHTARLLAQGALKQGSPRAASLVAAAVRQVLLASVCQGFHSSGPAGGGWARNCSPTPMSLSSLSLKLGPAGNGGTMLGVLIRCSN